MTNRIIITLCSVLLSSCWSVHTQDATEAFECWAGFKPTEDLEVLEGEYMRSPHFTLEYELFLKLRPSEKWIVEFIRINDLHLDNQDEEWRRFASFPEWFTPHPQAYIFSKNDGFDDSRYFLESDSNTLFIYETVGM